MPKVITFMFWYVGISKFEGFSPKIRKTGFVVSDELARASDSSPGRVGPVAFWSCSL
jgi:hypothetical protein